MSTPAPKKPKKTEGLDGCSKDEIGAFLRRLTPERMEKMIHLLDEVAQGDFYEKKRFTQAVRMLNAMKKHGVKQKDIATVLDLSEGRVSSYKTHFRHNPTEECPRPGLPSQLSDVYEVVKNFIDAKIEMGKPSPWRFSWASSSTSCESP